MDHKLVGRAFWQMALTLGMRILVACLGVGMPVLMLSAEAMYLRTGDRGWLILARRVVEGLLRPVCSGGGFRHSPLL